MSASHRLAIRTEWVDVVRATATPTVSTVERHPSCSGKITDAVITEVKLMGSEGSSRLKNGNDQIMAAAFKQIFKVDKSNTAAYAKATRALDTIAGMTPTDWKASDVRIYCDNDATDDKPGDGRRWQRVPDLPNASSKSKNSKKPFAQAQYWDHINQIFRRAGSRGCQDPGVHTAAQTYKIKDKDEATDQNPDRETITVCDQTFALPPPALFSAMGDSKDISQDLMDDFDELLSLTLFHELCHLTKVINVPGSRGDEPNGWDEISGLNAADSLNAADAFAFLGLSAILNKRNVRMASQESKAKLGGLQWITPPKKPDTGGSGSGSKIKRSSFSFGASAFDNMKQAVLFTAGGRRKRAVAFVS